MAMSSIGGSSTATSTSSSSSSIPSPLTSTTLRATSRSFFFGVGIALALCAAHLLATQSYGKDGREDIQHYWRQRALETITWASSHASGLQEASVLAGIAQEEKIDSIRRAGYTRRAVVDRFHTPIEVERMNEVKILGQSRSPEQASWQSQMASARARSGAPKSMRTRAATEGTKYTEAAALALRLAESRRRQQRVYQPARAHPLVGAEGRAYYSQRTLILYSFVPTDQEALSNMEFFIQTAVREHHQADYIFLLQNSPTLSQINENELPKLPQNAKYVTYTPPTPSSDPSSTTTLPADECGGFGPFGWLLKQQFPSVSEDGTTITQPAVVDSTSHPLFAAFGHYGYTMFVDSSVRGPWFPIWIDLNDPARVWYAAWQYHLERNQPDMHVVSSTISCQYGLPHVQLGAIMVDSTGWDLMDLNRDEILQCIPSMKSTTYAELSLSKVMLDSGSNLGSQMLAYQEVDFRSDSTCLGMSGDPQYDEVKSFDLGEGHFLDPLEILFVKYTREFKHYKSETFSDWKRWEEERFEHNKKSSRYFRRWTENDFRAEEEAKTEGETKRLKPQP